MKTLSFLIPLTVLLFSVPFAQAQIAATAQETKPLKKGAQAPDGKLVDSSGKAVALSDLAKTKPVVIIFYRGSWCGICMAQLKDVNGAIANFPKDDYQLIGVSPDNMEDVARTEKKLNLDFPLYSDGGNAVAQGFGLAFQARKNTVLPIPAVYVLDSKGKIEFAHSEPNFRKRLSPVEMFKSLIKK